MEFNSEVSRIKLNTKQAIEDAIQYIDNCYCTQREIKDAYEASYGTSILVEEAFNKSNLELETTRKELVRLLIE